ncbi:hypothetical protein DL766_008976 [Monosporascus sp. MC13-8B]|uniref:FAD-binding domain-containing protein n=1 Tax=Monosporascus cannonballus TaxID=155416 RepID=A0ABY0H5X4_9PEZI|nr:hypothetical protein DL762_005074 [Monosporascus cannonballus]RYO92107.1 hypothetical protein DL763_004799 [Monosporascus cannonballus]RYP17133.1 hypothetical protein DL766_008976 [Monosporascus sp. MC13-8B]
MHIYESHRPQGLTPSITPDPPLSKQGDPTDTTAAVGNSIALVPSSIRLLRYIDTRLYDIFKARGYKNESYTFKTARGHRIAVTSTGDNACPQEYTVSCPRYGLWECLRQAVGNDKIQYRKVIDVDLSGKKPVVKFADGGEEDADLVIGADGVRSVVKRASLGRKISASTLLVTNVDIPEAITRHKSIVFTLGPTGSFGYCSAAPESQRKLGWWSNWGTPDIPDGNVVNSEKIRRQLRDRHGTWKDPVIQYIIKNMTTDRVYPIWTTPDLPHWGERGAVLLGDAAHMKLETGDPSGGGDPLI